MNAALHWFATPEWAQVVRTLLHSLWQGALIAAALTLSLRRLTSPQSRYRCSLIALAAIPLAGFVTWAVLNTANHFPPPALPVPQVASETAVVPEIVALDANAKSKVVVVTRRNVTALPEANWTAWLALVWLVGAGLMLGRAGIKVAGAEQLRRSCRPLDHPAVMQLVVEARRAVGYARNLRVAVTDKLTSPAVVGVLLPTLVLPLTLLTTLSPEQIRFILLHELAHIRRGDYFANLFQLFTEALLFFNPAVSWISHQVRSEREACCDALAIELSGAPADYARTLVHVAENALNAVPAAAPAFGGQREPSSLSDRVQRLLVPGYRPSLRLTWRAMLAAFVLGAVLLVLSAEGTRVAVAQLAKSPEATPTVGEIIPMADKHEATNTSVASGVLVNASLLATDSTAAPTMNVPPVLAISSSNPNSQVEYNVAEGRVVVTNGGIVRFHDVVVQADSIELEHQSGKLRATGHARIESPPGTAETSPVNSNVAANAVQTASRTNLFTRTFTVEPNTFWNNLTNVTGISPAKKNVREAVRDYFATLGVELSPPKSVYFNDRTGEFLVRATAEDLDVIEAALQVANKYTPQVNIKVRFVEVERGETGSDWFPGARGNPSNLPPPTGSATTGTSSNADAQSFTGILTDPQYRVVLRALEQRKGYSLLSEGEVTTLSGRPAQIQVVELRTIANGYEPRRGGLESLRKQAKEQDVAIEKANADLAELRVKLHISDSDASGSAPQQRVSNEEYRRYIATKFEREVAYRGNKEQFDQLKALSKAQLRDVLPGMPGLESGPTLNELINELNAADQKLASLGNVVSEKHPEYIRIKEQQKLLNDKIDARVAGIMKRLETQLAVAKAELDSLTDSVESARKLDQEKLTESRPYYDKKRELDDMINFRRLLTRKINLEEIYHLPPSVPIPSLPGSTETNLANTNLFHAQTLPFGPVIDVTPTVSADGHTIQMTVIPTLTEFLGYDDPKKVLPPGDPRSNGETLPLPRVRVRRVTTSANVWDGQTLVLSMGDDQFISKQPGGDVQKGRNPDAPEKQLLVFITPTIIDPAGNRVNADAETLPAGLQPLRK